MDLANMTFTSTATLMTKKGWSAMIVIYDGTSEKDVKLSD